MIPAARRIGTDWLASLVVICAIGCADAPADKTDEPIRQTAVTPVAQASASKTIASTFTQTRTAVSAPSPRPDRIILSWADDPSMTQAVTWRTDATVAVGLAEIAVAEDNADFTRRARQLKATTTPFIADSISANYHSVQFKALSPKTKYVYRVGGGGQWSEWFHFATAGSQPEPFTFVYFGDAQTDLKSLWSRVIRESILHAPRTRFLLHSGDLVNSADSDFEWNEWFQAAGWLNGMIPCVPTPGNHEYRTTATSTTASLTPHWAAQFTLPENGPAGLAESTYWFDYQGVRIVSMNSNEKLPEQASWLDELLQNNPCRWTIITFHHPIYSPARSRDNLKLRSTWQPIFDKHRVDLCLQGHDHAYARSGLVEGKAAAVATNVPAGVTQRSESAGTVYVVSVSGPKMYDLDKPMRPEFQRVAEDVQLFQIITIDGDELRFEARTATGAVYDGFTLRKRPGQPNEMIENTPSLQQRVRPVTPQPTSATALPKGF